MSEQRLWSPSLEDPEPEDDYSRPLTDNEVRALGYTHRDADGNWIRRPLPPPEPLGRLPIAPARPHVLRHACLSCGSRFPDHPDWCSLKANADDHAAAETWNPHPDLEPDPDRNQYDWMTGRELKRLKLIRGTIG